MEEVGICDKMSERRFVQIKNKQHYTALKRLTSTWNQINYGKISPKLFSSVAYFFYQHVHAVENKSKQYMYVTNKKNNRTPMQLLLHV